MNDHALQQALVNDLQNTLKAPPDGTAIGIRRSDDDGTRAATRLAKVTSPDTERATRNMGEQMAKIIAGLEGDIAEAEAVAATVAKRIANLQKALGSSRAAYAVLLISGG